MAAGTWARLVGGAGVVAAMCTCASFASMSAAKGAPSAQVAPAKGVAARGARSVAAAPAPPPPNASIVGRITLSGYGSKLQHPTAPTHRPLYTDCHQLLDPAFQGSCIIVRGAKGWVAGVVEVEHGASSSQERELVWHRQGEQWTLTLVRVLIGASNPGRLWSVAARPGADPYLAFVSPVARSGFGADLSLVSTTGVVQLYRFLGQGFVQVPPFGGLLTYVPGFTEAMPASSYFDQALIGYVDGAWRVVSQQYVPYAAAMAQHHGILTGPGVVAAS